MGSDSVARLFSEAGDLPVLPEALSKVIELSRNPDVDARLLCDAIADDPALSARVLRFANSSFCGVARQVSSLSRAVVLLGYKRVEALAVAAYAHSMCDLLGRTERRRASALWEHSLATSAAARALARRLVPESEEECFVAGLLHDMGKAILLTRFPDAVSRTLGAAATTGRAVIECEREDLGFGHDEVIEFLLSRWDLPDAIRSAAGYHHRPLLAPGGPLLPAVVAAASRMATDLGYALADWSGSSGPAGEEDSRVSLGEEDLAAAVDAVEAWGSEWRAAGG